MLALWFRSKRIRHAKAFVRTSVCPKAAEDVRLFAFLAVGFIFLLIAGRVISSKERTIERVTVPEVAERIADASQRDLSH